MSDHDRGAYTPPTEEPLAFDARMTRTRRPLPMTLIASAAVLLVLVVAVVLFYRSGVRGANEPPRVVGETVAELKTAPVEEAKPIDPTAGLEVYVDDGQGGQTAAPTFAPPPEQPQPRPQPTAPVEVATAPPVTTVVPPPAVRPAQPTPAPTPAVAKAAPAPAPAPAKAAPVQVAEATKAAPAPSAGGGASVQIGAFSSAAIADVEFNKIRSAFGAQTAGKGKKVETVERNGQTLYRTLVTGFSRSDAQAFCNALKASGRSCLVK